MGFLEAADMCCGLRQMNEGFLEISSVLLVGSCGVSQYPEQSDIQDGSDSQNVLWLEPQIRLK